MCCQYISGATIAMSYARRIYNIMMTSFSMSAVSYAPGILYTATSFPLYAPITAVSNNNSNAMVGDVASSFLVFVVYQLPSAHALPLIEPSCFYFRRIKDLSDSLFCSQVSYQYTRVSMASLLCSWVISFMTASAPFLGYFFSPFSDECCVIRKCNILFCNYSL